MVPVQVSRPHRVAAKPRGSDVGGSVQSGSQSSGEDEVAKMAERLKKDAKGRRAKRRSDIRNAYNKSVREMEYSTTVKFDGMMNSMTIRHRRRLERLQDLIIKRTAIEVRMLASIKNIENAFDFADKAFSSALAHRIQALAT